MGAPPLLPRSPPASAFKNSALGLMSLVSSTQARPMSWQAVGPSTPNPRPPPSVEAVKMASTVTARGGASRAVLERRRFAFS